MGSVAVINAVEGYLAANWSECPVIGAKTPHDQQRDEDADFLVVQYLAPNSEQMTIGAPGENVWRTEGALRFQMFFDRQAPRINAWQRADNLAVLFRGKDIGGVVRTFAPSMPVLDDNNDTATFFRLTFAVPYQYDLLA